jgi:formylglycine-generating enzyme required for sulfatase activity
MLKKTLGLYLSIATSAIAMPMALAQDPQGSNLASVKLTWAKIPAGRFTMGSQVPVKQLVKDYASYLRKEEEFQDEYPAHPVEITKPFLLSR